MIRSLPDKTWKAVLAAFTLLALIEIAFCLALSPAFLGPPKTGTLGFTSTREPIFLSTRRVIQTLQPNSPLRAAGAEVGDLFEWDNRVGPLSSRPGEAVGITLYKDGTGTHRVVQTIEGDDHFLGTRATSYLVLAYSMSGVAFGLLIGFKRPDAIALRYLALAFIAFPLSYGLAFAAPGVSRLVASFAVPFTNVVIYGGYVMFALLFAGEPTRGRRSRLYRWRAVPLGAIAVTWLMVLASGPGGWFIPGIEVTWRVTMVLAFGTIILSLWEPWHDSLGETRTRYLWVLMAFVMKMGLIAARDFDLLLDPNWYFVGQLACHLLILFVIFRHRVFGFGFALNRAIAFSISSFLVLFAFGIIEWLAERLLHFQSREQNLFLDAFVAVGLIYRFHRFHLVVDQALKKLLFHQWFANDEALRLFVKRAAFMTHADALYPSFGRELQRYTGGADCLIFRRSRDGDFEAIYDSRSRGPARISGDDGIAVALRADDTPLALERITTEVAGAWAFAMTHRATLHGFVVLDCKPSADAYRPDEIDLISFAVRHVGLDLLAMEVETLQRELERRDIEVRALRSSTLSTSRLTETD